MSKTFWTTSFLTETRLTIGHWYKMLKSDKNILLRTTTITKIELRHQVYQSIFKISFAKVWSNLALATHHSKQKNSVNKRRKHLQSKNVVFPYILANHNQVLVIGLCYQCHHHVRSYHHHVMSTPISRFNSLTLIVKLLSFHIKKDRTRRICYCVFTRSFYSYIGLENLIFCHWLVLIEGGEQDFFSDIFIHSNAIMCWDIFPFCLLFLSMDCVINQHPLKHQHLLPCITYISVTQRS